MSNIRGHLNVSPVDVYYGKVDEIIKKRLKFKTITIVCKKMYTKNLNLKKNKKNI
jgi:hypothetical protein